jgi:hypothetical protein
MGFAHELRKATRKHTLYGEKVAANVVDLQEYNPKFVLSSSLFSLPSLVVLLSFRFGCFFRTMPEDGLVVLVTACFGKGEPTDNARSFFDWLMSKVCLFFLFCCLLSHLLLLPSFPPFSSLLSSLSPSPSTGS